MYMNIKQIFGCASDRSNCFALEGTNCPPSTKRWSALGIMDDLLMRHRSRHWLMQSSLLPDGLRNVDEFLVRHWRKP